MAHSRRSRAGHGAGHWSAAGPYQRAQPWSGICATLGRVFSVRHRKQAARAQHATTCSRRDCLVAAAALSLAAIVRADEEQPVIIDLPVAGGQIELQFTPDFSDAQRERARRWVTSGAEAVAGFFGRFPVPQLELLLQGVEGEGVISGATFGEPTLHLRVRLGRDTTAAAYRDDWVLVHELVHLAVPRVPPAQRWLHEGIATYVGPLVRCRAGLLEAPQMWQGWMRQMPRGQPEAGDRGLDHTPTWGRVYWGGALFCLLADVRMRQRGPIGRGLQQALQGLQRAGGDYRVAWPLQRTLALADAAVGGTTLTDLYDELKDSASPTDLASLWRELGVEDDRLRDDAPLAPVRRAIAT